MSDADGRKKTALVCGAGGFIGSHLVRRLVKDGYWVRGADQKHTEFSPTAAHDFQRVDLRDAANCEAAVRTRDGKPFDEVYQLAADMGGMGFIHSAECEIMRNSCLVNLNMTHAAATAGVPALPLLLVGLRLPRHGAERARDRRGPRPTRPCPTTSTAGRSSTPSARRWRTGAATR